MALPHIRLRVGGNLYADARWSIGLNFRSNVNGDPPGGLTSVQGKLESFRDAVRAFNSGNILPDAALSHLSAQGGIDQVRVAYVGDSGKEEAVALVDLANVVVGTGQPLYPAQTAVCVSLRTGRPGASYRGRMYLPKLGRNLTTGRMPANDRLELCNAMGGWVHDIGQAGSSFFSPGLTAVVLSTVRGVSSPITSVAVGDRLDIQRRRAEGQSESYAVAVVPQ